MTSKLSEKTESKLNCEELEELYVKNEKLVYQCLRRCFPAYWLDEDFQQEAKLALWRACQDYDPEKGALSTLAWAYIRNQINQQIRLANCQKIPKNAVSLSEVVFGDSNGGDTMRLEDVLPSAPDVEWHDWQAWWDSLTKRQKQVITLRCDGKSYRDIEGILGISHTLVWQEIGRARKNARKYL